MPNLKNAVPTLRALFRPAHLFGHGAGLQPQPCAAQGFADLWNEKYRGKVGIVDGCNGHQRRGDRRRRHTVGLRAGQEEAARAQEARRARAADQRGDGAGAAVGRGVDHADVARARDPVAERRHPGHQCRPDRRRDPHRVRFRRAEERAQQGRRLRLAERLARPQAQVAFAQKMGYAPTVSNMRSCHRGGAEAHLQRRKSRPS